MPLNFEQPEEQSQNLFPPQTPREEVALPKEAVKAEAKQKRIQRLLRFLSPKSMVRQLAEPHLNSGTPQPPPQTLEPIRRSMIRNLLPHWREKEVALWYLKRATLTEEQKMEAVGFLTQYLKTSLGKGFSRLAWSLFCLEGILTALFLTAGNMTETHVAFWRKPFTFFVQWWSRTWMQLVRPLYEGIGSFFGVSFFLNSAPHIYWTFMILIGLPFFGFLPFTALYVAWDARKLARIHAMVLDTLGDLGEVCAIPTLAEYASKGNFPLNQKARTALQKLLPRLASEHLGTFSSQTIPNLSKLLSGGTTEFNLAVIAALNLIGDARAIPALQLLIQRTEDFEMRALVREVIYVLEVREAEASLKQNLLRASHPPKDTPDQLLRPVVGEPDNAPAELLRPSSPKNSSNEVL